MIGLNDRVDELQRPEIATGDIESAHKPVWIALGAVLVIAVALRAYRIDGQSLWYDEGVSAAMATRDLVDITIRSVGDIHPPLYYYLLSLWSAFAGTSELALRWFSLSSGVLLVASSYALGTRLFNPQAGAFAAFFAALSPFLIYYSQEARMYSQVAFLALLSFYLCVRLIHRMSRGEASSSARLVALVASYIVVTSAMLYSHYFSFSILVAQNVVALGLVVLDRRPGTGTIRPLATWIAVELIAVVTYVPWLVLTLDQLQSWPSVSEAFGLDALLRRVFLVFSFGLPSDAVATPRREIVFYTLLIAAFLFPVVRYRRSYLGIAALALYLATPVLILYALSLNRPMYNPKFLLLAAPAYYLLLGAGLEGCRQIGHRALNTLGTRLPRLVPVAWSLVVVVVFAALVAYPIGKSLAAYHLEPKFARDDYRGLVDFVASRMGPEDAIILNAPGQEEIFRYYYRLDGAVYPLPRQRPIDDAETSNDLKSIVRKHPRVWLVLWATAESDPKSFVEHWLDENSFKTETRWFGNIRLCLFSNASAAANGERVSVDFENGLRLSSLQLGNRTLEPGDSLNLTLGWEADRKIDERYTVFVHIIDQSEHIWGQMDGEPAGGSKPTDVWTKGTQVEDRRGIQVLPGTPPGQYSLEVGLYQSKSGKRLAITDNTGKTIGDRSVFGLISVDLPRFPPSIGSLGAILPLRVSFVNRVNLIGFKLNPLGRDSEGATFSAADIAHLTLFWQSGGSPESDASVRIEVRDLGGRAVLQEKRRIADGKYPTSRWREGDLIRDQYKLRLAGLASGEYQIYLAQLDRGDKVIRVESGDVAADGSVPVSRLRVR